MPLNKDWREFLELLKSNGVEYRYSEIFTDAESGRLREDPPTQNL
jgi:hypothetical protein